MGLMKTRLRLEMTWEKLRKEGGGVIYNECHLKSKMVFVP